MVAGDICVHATCKYRARFGVYCGHHAPRCTVVTDGKKCQRAVQPGLFCCSNHESKVTCEICYEEIPESNMEKLQMCTHSFCKSCINKWMESSGSNGRSCPMCRRYIVRNTNDMLYVFRTLFQKNMNTRGLSNRIAVCDEIFYYLSRDVTRTLIQCNRFWDTAKARLAYFEANIIDGQEIPYIAKWKQQLSFLY